jgi:hypothetical protein
MDAKSRKFARNDVPPPAKRVSPIVYVKPHYDLRVAILSPALQGYMTHWNGSKTRPCYDGKKTCEGCAAGQPKRWKGFLYVYEYSTKNTFFVEITPYSAENFFGQLIPKQPLRGLQVLIRREQPRKNAPIKIDLYGVHDDTIPLPVSRDVEATLRKIWSLESD